METKEERKKRQTTAEATQNRSRKGEGSYSAARKAEKSRKKKNRKWKHRLAKCSIKQKVEAKTRLEKVKQKTDWKIKQNREAKT